MNVGLYIKDTIKYKEQQELSKLDENIEHIWIKCEGKNENKNWLVGVLYQPCSEDKAKLKCIQKLDTILSTVTTTFRKTVIITGDTNIDYNKSSAVLKKYKKVINAYNLKQHITNPTRQGAKTIDHIISKLQTERILITDAIPFRNVSDHYAPYTILKILTKSIQTRFKYI